MRTSFKVLALGAIACLSLTACGSSPASSDGKSADAKSNSKKIILVSKGFQHTFWQSVKKGALEKGKELGYEVEFIGPKNETAVTEQLDQLKNALNAKPAAIGLAALDSKAAEPILQQIKNAGIPVIAFDSGVDSDIPLTTVQTDNRTAGAKAAEKLAQLMGNKGTVGIVCHGQATTTGKGRCFGFQDWMKEHAPGIKLLQEQWADERGKAADAAKAIVKSNTDVTAMYGSNEVTAAGVLQGVKEAGKMGQITIVGFDSGKAQIDAIKSGDEAGAITQAPVKMGAETVAAADKAIKGESLEKIIDSGFAWYDKSNIDTPEIQSNIYE
ncbi:ABC transporter substrate-binding protein [Mobiluncus mulieris]|uniref:ABC transporter substrate-binding protein n=1 Tax=Mobiluncus mulieris TaxID=2052 RepID=UPI0014705640|nr:ABC transporter substrate-binding protein [Mobiluncus mulieris]MCU9976067.1 ABC transporter substrate-binding protein [Mobiluncus mulieris]NMW81464.1 ABC transporter substrate-binding protein [Mobiluncus mulieris]